MVPACLTASVLHESSSSAAPLDAALPAQSDSEQQQQQALSGEQQQQQALSGEQQQHTQTVQSPHCAC